MIKRLIWDSQAPAPFESAWSLLVKVMALNQLTPAKLHELIAVDGETYFHGLDFRRSSWVNFNKLEQMLGVTEKRLRGCFLDQLFLNDHSTGVATQGVRLCTACLAKGFHSIFFELPFIDRCPWHDRPLEDYCQDCYAAASYLGLRKCRTTSVNKSNLDIGSGCGHIRFNSDSIQKLNQLSVNDERVVVKHCMQLYQWAQNALSRPEISAKLFSAHAYVNPALMAKCLSAAEQIAGPCPWDSEIERPAITWLEWQQPTFANTEIRPLNGTSTPYHQCYRAIRRYLYHRHIRTHRKCLSKLIRLSIDEFHALDSDSICPAVLAYFAWRAFFEMKPGVAELLCKEAVPERLAATWIHLPGYINTMKGACNLLFARFYNLWQEIENAAGRSGFSICIIRGPAQEDSLSVIGSMDEVHWLLRQTHRCTVLIPNPKSLEIKGMVRCSGRMKRHSLTQPSLSNPMLYRYAIRGKEEGFNSVVFQARKSKGEVINRYIHQIHV